MDRIHFLPLSVAATLPVFAIFLQHCCPFGNKTAHLTKKLYTLQGSYSPIFFVLLKHKKDIWCLTLLTLP
jgi:hypothetical protein